MSLVRPQDRLGVPMAESREERDRAVETQITWLREQIKAEADEPQPSVTRLAHLARRIELLSEQLKEKS